MAEQILINGKRTTTVSFTDRGLNYGDGVFETIAVFENQPLCWEEHITRLKLGCERLKIPFSDLEQLKEEADSLIEADKQKQILKLVITRGEGGRGYALPEKCNPTRILSIHPWPDYPDTHYQKGINTRICNTRYSLNPLLAGIKHLNRLEQVLARAEWNDPDIQEGIVRDKEGNVIEGTMSNLFYVYGTQLFTPLLESSGIEGIIRQKIIEQASSMNLKVNVNKIKLDDLLSADEVFLCNSVIGVWPIRKIDEHEFTVGKITKQINETLIKHNCISPVC